MLVDFLIETATRPGNYEHHLMDNFVNRTPQYMLFMKRMKDGRYEPASGHIDPVMSIRRVSAPPEAEDQKKSN